MKGFEAEHLPCDALDEPMVLLKDIVRKRCVRPTRFQFDGLKFQGSRSSIFACG